MLEIQGQVTYRDGRKQPFIAGPFEVAQWEAYAARKGLSAETAPLNFSLYISYAAVHSDNWPPEIGFEGWSPTVADIDLEDPDEVPPTETVSTDAS